jgi:ABC-type phosphate transport system substrate-binding protein
MPRRRKAIMLAGIMTLPCLLAVLTGTAANASPGGAPAAPSTAVNLALIDGSGSTWAQNAVDQWIANVAQQGVQVVFTGDGSASGRQDFALHTTDFAVSDIGYQGFDPVTGTNDSSSRPYAYLPVTAGGTSFPYNIVVAGKQIKNLRLSGLTLARIFTNQITNWDDPAITKDNNNRKLPSLPITTVVPSEGSGTTAQFTRYLNYLFPTLWKNFNHGISGMTEYWPRQGTSQVAQSGSTAIMNYVAQPGSNGAIGVDEYSYPLAQGFPVVNLENAAHYFVLPSEYNDAVALTQAQINYNQKSKNYLLENLNNVYTYSDPRAYPLSSYSYTVMPVSKTDPRMQVPAGTFPAKWQTLADFLYYSICQGQTYIGPIGYSALPINLVEAGFRQIDKIKKAAPQVQIKQQNVKTCHNPTFVFGHPNENYLATHAPYPPKCDKAGQGPCKGVTNANGNGGHGSNGGGNGNGNGNGSGNGNGNGGGNGGSPTPTPSGSQGGGGSGGTGGTGGTGAGPTPTTSINPVTGQTVTEGAGGGGGGTGSSGSSSAVPNVLAAGEFNRLGEFLGPIAVVLLLILLVAPPLLARYWSRSGRKI